MNLLSSISVNQVLTGVAIVTSSSVVSIFTSFLLGGCIVYCIYPTIKTSNFDNNNRPILNSPHYRTDPKTNNLIETEDSTILIPYDTFNQKKEVFGILLSAYMDLTEKTKKINFLVMTLVTSLTSAIIGFSIAKIVVIILPHTDPRVILVSTFFSSIVGFAMGYCQDPYCWLKISTKTVN